MHRMLLFLVVASAAAALCSLVTAGAAGFRWEARTAINTLAVDQPELDTSARTTALGARATTELDLYVPAAAAEVAKVTIYVPSGYALDLTARPGTAEGFVLGWDPIGIGKVGSITAADPASYASSPGAQACAPGVHAAVWTMELGVGLGSNQQDLPIFVDPTTPDEAGLGAYRLQACIPLSSLPSPGGSPLGERLQGLDLGLTDVTNPATTGMYVWRELVTAPSSSGTPDPATTYELRSDIPLPSRLTLRGSYDRKRGTVSLRGRWIAPAMNPVGTPIGLYRVTRSTVPFLGWTRAHTDGSFAFRRKIKTTTVYSAEIDAIDPTCNGPSAAPAGCLNETLVTIRSPNAKVVVKRRRRP